MSTLSPSTSRTALRSRQRDARGFTVTALTTKTGLVLRRLRPYDFNKRRLFDLTGVR
jgi:hypothetical protein